MADQSQSNSNEPPAAETPRAAVMPVQDLPGRLVKRVDVPPDGFAVVEDSNGNARQLEGRSPAVGGVWHRISHPFGQTSTWATAVKTRQLTLRPSVTNLLTADGELVEADWLVTAEVSDAMTAYQRLIRPALVLTEARLSSALGAQAHSTLRAQVRDYLAEKLLHDPQVVASVSQALSAFLHSYLGIVGFDTLRVEHLTFHRMEERAETAAKLRSLQQRLRQGELQAQMQAIKERYQLQEFAEQMEHELEMRQLFRQEELDTLWRNIEADGVEPAVIVDQTTRLLAEKVEEADQRNETRAQQLAMRLQAEPDAAPFVDQQLAAELGDENGLRRLVSFLRYLGAAVLSAVTLFAILRPDLFGAERQLEIIAAAFGLLIAVLSLLSADWVASKARQRRMARLAELTSGRMSEAEQARVDQLVRLNTIASLKRSTDRVSAAKDALLRANERTLAADLKQIENRLGSLTRQAEVMTPVFAAQGARTQSQVQAAALADMEEKLLAQAEFLADLGAQAQERAQSSQAAAVQKLIAPLENVALEVKNLFEDRSRVLQKL